MKMKTDAMLWAGVLLLVGAGAWAQQGPQGGDDGPDGPPEMGGAQQPGQRGPGGPGGQMGPGGPMGGPHGHHGMGGPGLGGPGGPPEPLTEAQESELVSFIKANEPNMAEHLAMVKQHDPIDYRRQVAEMWRMYKDPDVRQQFGKTMKSNRTVRELVEQYRKSPDAEKPAIKEKLVKAVGEQFDLDVAGKELQIKKMQEQITQLKEKISKRRESKDKYVSKRVERVTGEGEDWEW